MTENCSAGEQAPHASTAQPSAGDDPASKPVPARWKPKPPQPPRRDRARREEAKRVRMANRAQRSAAAASSPARQGSRDVHTEPDQPSTGDKVIRVGSPASLLALVPQLLTFQPRNSIVLLGAQPPRGRVRLTLRFDLPPTPDPTLADELARHAMAVLVAQGFTTGVAVGY